MNATAKQDQRKFKQNTKGTPKLALHLEVLRKFTVCLAVGSLLEEVSTFTREAHAQGGVPVWTNIIVDSAPTGGAVAVDHDGNVFVAANVTVKYSGAGVPLWTNSYSWWDRPVIAVDKTGNVVVTGTVLDSDSHYGTVKYSNAGVPLWTNVYGTPSHAYGAALDGTGNVFVTGLSAGATGSATTIKVSSAGVSLWTNFFYGLSNIGASGYAIAADANGNVFVAVESLANNGWADWATVKYSSLGTLLWARGFNGPGNGNDDPSAIGVDINGKVFVKGISTGTNNSLDSITIGYSNSGVPLWTNYQGLTSWDQYRSLAVDSNGNVFVADWDSLTIAYSNSGVPLWTNRNEGGGAHALAVDGKGNVFVTGGNYLTTIAYSKAGAPLWTNRYFGPADIEVLGYAVTVDSSNNVIAAGTSRDTNGYYSSVIIKYSAQPAVAPPPLEIRRLGNAVVLNWTNPAFSLQSAPSATGTFVDVLDAPSPFTNPVSTARQFFRLKAN